jgi:hypothetical protein
LAVELGYVETGAAAIRATGTKYSLVIDAKLRFPLMILSEVSDKGVGISAIRMAALESAACVAYVC